MSLTMTKTAFIDIQELDNVLLEEYKLIPLAIDIEAAPGEVMRVNILFFIDIEFILPAPDDFE